MKMRLQVLTILVAMLVAPQLALAAWGDYDTSFGFLGGALDGSVTNHTPRAIALQSDGKILVTGYRLVGGKKRFFLRRYLSNGDVDTSFGNNGSAISNAWIVADADYAGEKIVVQANGKIAVAGMGNSKPTLWRFHSSGSADTTMGNGGMKSLSAYSTVSPQITTYSDILYVGVASGNQPTIVLIKFNPNGSQDTAFGSGGEAVAGVDFRGYSLMTEPVTGNILVGGRPPYPAPGYGVARFLTTGVLDTTFSNFESDFVGFPGHFPSQFVRRSNGQFVMNERSVNIAQGGATVGSNIVRLSSTGAFTSRHTYEPTTFIQLGLGDCPDVMAMQSDDRLVVRGVNDDEVFRFSSNFLTSTTINCAAYANLGNPTTAVLQTDDKMIAAGTYNGYIAMVRTMP